MKKLSKKKKKFKKHKNYLNAWDNAFSFNNNSHNFYNYDPFECTPQDVNKIALDVFGALYVSVSDLIIYNNN